MKNLLAPKVVIVSIFILLILSSCSELVTLKEVENPNNAANQFLDSETADNTIVLGRMQHRLANVELDDNGKGLPISYDGGDLEIEYIVCASGTAKNVGFLLFIDGIPQPYRVNSNSSSHQHMHIFDLQEDDEEMLFSFIFTPITGKKGDILTLTVTSIYNPSFMPDMRDFLSYEGYQTTLSVYIPIVFEENIDPIDISTLPNFTCLQNVQVEYETITQELLDGNSNKCNDLDLEDNLNTEYIAKYNFGNEENIVDNFLIDSNGMLHMTFEITGKPGTKYRHTFYINHQALADGNQKFCFETVLRENNISVVEMELDLSKLEPFNTFYMISTPYGLENPFDSNCILQKTPSVLLYKN